MSEPHLLPPNATPLERAMAKAGRLPHKPEIIRTLWSPWDCPLTMLPWLAWAWVLQACWAAAVARPKLEVVPNDGGSSVIVRKSALRALFLWIAS